MLLNNSSRNFDKIRYLNEIWTNLGIPNIQGVPRSYATFQFQFSLSSLIFLKFGHKLLRNVKIFLSSNIHIFWFTDAKRNTDFEMCVFELLT